MKNLKLVKRTELAEWFGVTPETITNWGKEGVLTEINIKDKKTNIAYYTEESVNKLIEKFPCIVEVEREIERYKDKCLYISALEAAEMLGTDEDGVKYLIDCGILVESQENHMIFRETVIEYLKYNEKDLERNRITSLLELRDIVNKEKSELREYQWWYKKEISSNSVVMKKLLKLLEICKTSPSCSKTHGITNLWKKDNIEDLLDDVSQLIKEIPEENKKIEKLEKELQETKDFLRTERLEVSKLERKLKNYEELKKETERLRKILATRTEAQEDIDFYRIIAEKYEKENKNLSDQIQLILENSKPLNEVKTLENKIKTQEKTIKELSKELNLIVEENAILRDENGNSSRNLNEKTINHYNNPKKIKGKLGDNNLSLNFKIRELESNNQALNRNAKILVSENKSLRIKLGRLTGKLKKFSEYYQSMDEKEKSYCADNQELRKINSRLVNSNKNLRKENEYLREHRGSNKQSEQNQSESKNDEECGGRRKFFKPPKFENTKKKLFEFKKPNGNRMAVLESTLKMAQGATLMCAGIALVAGYAALFLDLNLKKKGE